MIYKIRIIINMPLTNAERQKIYRDKKKQLNIEEYKSNQSLKNKKYYSKLKNEEEESSNEDEEPSNKEEEPNEEFILLKQLKKRINPLNKSVINESTVKIYLNSMKNIYKNYNKTDLDDDTELINVLTNKKYDLAKLNYQFGFIKTDIYEVIKNNPKDLRNLYSVITRIRTFSKQVKQLYPYIEQKQNIYNEKRKNKIIDKNIDKKMSALSFEKDDILDKLKTIDDNHEKLIYGLMMLFPTRRPVDYRKMLITNEKPVKNKKNNYYYNKQFYFYVTKNKAIQKFDVPDELDELINKNYTYLLSHKNNPYSTTTLSLAIMRIFNKIYGISISAVEIRRFYSTYLKELYDNKKITEKQHREISEMMNHSYEENKKYAYNI